MWNDTIARLRDFSDSAEFERLCADLLRRTGFPDIVPRGPGLQDSGADAEALFGSSRRVFQFSVQKTWERKILDTLGKLKKDHRLSPQGLLIFVTNQSAPPKKVDSLRAKARVSQSFHLQVLDIEWLRTQLEFYQDLRLNYLGIPISSTIQDSDPVFRDALSTYSIEDCVKHALQLAMIQRTPCDRLVDFFCREWLLPYLVDGTTHKLVLFPVRRDSVLETTTQRLIHTNDRPENVTFKGRPVSSGHSAAPADLNIEFFATNDESKLPYFLHPIHGGLLAYPRFAITDRHESAIFVLAFIKAKISAHAADLCEQHSVDYGYAHAQMIGVEKSFTRFVMSDLALHFAELGNCESLCFTLRDLYDISGSNPRCLLPQWIPSEFFECLGLSRFRTIVLAPCEVRHVHELVALLDDYRVPLAFFETVVELAQMLDPEDGEWEAWIEVARRRRDLLGQGHE